jgi:hypothetical protein
MKVRPVRLAKLGGVGQAIPIDLLHLPGFVRVQQEVAAGGTS